MLLKTFSNIKEKVDSVCDYDATESSCSSFEQGELVESVLNQARRATRKAFDVGLMKAKATCPTLFELRSKIKSSRDHIYKIRNVVESKFTEISKGNSECSRVIASNIASDACVDSLNPNGTFPNLHRDIKEYSRESCQVGSMEILQGLLVTKLQDQAQKTCSILNKHEKASSHERKLLNSYKKLDVVIESLDNTIIELNKSISECKKSA